MELKKYRIPKEIFNQPIIILVLGKSSTNLTNPMQMI